MSLRSKLLGWKTAVIAFALTVAGILNWYDDIKEKGRGFVCDVAHGTDIADSIEFCSPPTPDDADLVAKINFLEDNKNLLSEERRTELTRLKQRLADRAYKSLQMALGKDEIDTEGSFGKSEKSGVESASDMRRTVEAIVEAGPAERSALKLIAEGKFSEGLDLLERLVDSRHFARIAYPIDTARAIATYERLIGRNWSNVWDVAYLSRLYRRSGNLSAAEQAIRTSLTALPRTAARDRSVLLDELGDVLLARGNHEAALRSYRSSLKIAEQLSWENLGNVYFQHDLSVSYSNIGNVLFARGDYDSALDNHQKSVRIRETLVANSSTDQQWKRELSVSYNRVGDVLLAQGKPYDAIGSYRSALTIRTDLVASSPNNIEWQRDLLGSHNNMGEVLLAQGDHRGALESFRTGVFIGQHLTETDPKNTGWQRALSVSYDGIGDAMSAVGDRAAALENYQAGMDIHERLVAGEPDNAYWQRDYALASSKLAGFPESGVTWADAAGRWQAMADRGVLAPVDQHYLDEARHEAGISNED